MSFSVIPFRLDGTLMELVDCSDVANKVTKKIISLQDFELKVKRCIFKKVVQCQDIWNSLVSNSS